MKPRRLLFVCTGNTCRSPMARFLAERIAREAGLPCTASSAGLYATPGAPITDEAKRALEERGVKEAKHSARLLAAEDLGAADEVYAMTRAHRAAIAGRFPDHAAKVKVLREAARLADADVADPIGRPYPDYQHCAARIEEALRILIRRTHAENAR